MLSDFRPPGTSSSSPREISIPSLTATLLACKDSPTDLRQKLFYITLRLYNPGITCIVTTVLYYIFLLNELFYHKSHPNPGKGNVTDGGRRKRGRGITLSWLPPISVKLTVFMLRMDLSCGTQNPQHLLVRRNSCSNASYTLGLFVPFCFGL